MVLQAYVLQKILRRVQQPQKESCRVFFLCRSQVDFLSATWSDELIEQSSKLSEAGAMRSW